MRFATIADLGGELLESPVWDDRRGVIFCCDIEAGRIHAVSLEGGTRVWEMGGIVASLGLCESGRLVVALAREVVLFDPETGETEPLWAGFDEPAPARLNDGKTGPDGAFWVGGMEASAPRSKLYRVTADGRATVASEGFKASNGLAWSGDGRVMFHSDSMGPWLDRYDFDPVSGGISGRRRIRTLDQATGRPDGGATDLAGGYWSAGAFAGVLNRFDAEGALLERVALPCPAPTMPCFCGPELRQLAVVSRANPDDPAAPRGAVFLAEAPVAGVPVIRMAGC